MDLSEVPTSMQQVARESTQVVIGEVVEVVPIAAFEGSDQFRVRYRVAVERTVVGESREPPDLLRGLRSLDALADALSAGP